ncbi:MULTISPECIES: lytic murein transglycosylase [Pseudomonadaceae]|uniref:Membrane-bound lytic murein transglycosylase B n=3 Tax=Pseudomonadaceae TaxID=135621 RepID=A0A3D9EMF3_ECTOL|nr:MULTISPECIES: lytic murein transglycosylase [Pseudomonas]MCI1008163.1 lytic murein transglycosylase [Pseudomonas oryzihabitans]MDK4199892.1 lytic murein transglycosylase [Pseudomonas sp. HR1]MDU4056569.1 lytic murein transglycosylase [Pseudomonas oryzihabitans]NMZ45602.1 lytic murein transglycosylase [Pseudomonas oryzihabitans]NMZ64139.1 lytic murein transglycosylase [Pseudomonas oryzihabitans]
MQFGKTRGFKTGGLLAGTLVTLLTAALAACAQTQTTPSAAPSSPSSSKPAPAANAPASAAEAMPQPDESFEQWRSRFRTLALGRGISAATFDQAFAGVQPDPAVIAADRSQPEFTKPVWEYLESAVSPLRVRNGKSLLIQQAGLLASLEARYGIEPARLVAFWGMESNYGNNMGNKGVIRSLATLAYEGRRPDFAQDQLIAALGILQHGDVTADRMIGSWAGAMGQTQFIPTTYDQYAVDFDGDGRRDIWGSTADALASTANYLKASGWQDGKPWGYEVRVPANFDYSLADMGVRKSLAEWNALGIQGLGLPQPAAQPSDSASLLLPAGHRGPAFLVFNNFRTILKYNNSSSYALGVALLSERYRDAGQIAGSWPTDDLPLSRSERVELQQRLAALGLDPGSADGIIGANTRKAIRAYQQSQGWPADGYPNHQLLDKLRG